VYYSKYTHGTKKLHTFVVTFINSYHREGSKNDITTGTQQYRKIGFSTFQLAIYIENVQEISR
jgi:hypothetical protein